MSSKKVAMKAIKNPEVAQNFPIHIGAPKHLDRYEVEGAANTLERHQEVKSNRKLHRAAIKHLKMKQKLIARAAAGK